MDDDKIDSDDITIGSSDTIDTIDLNDILTASVTIPSLWNTPSGNVTISSTSSSYGTYSIGAGGTSGSYLYTSAGSNGTSWGTPTNNSNTLQVNGDANFEGDIKVKGRSLEKMFQKIEDRLAILQDPDPKKLEKYAALKKAYDHYKTLERLIGED
jgi:hypothetical protein